MDMSCPLIASPGTQGRPCRPNRPMQITLILKAPSSTIVACPSQPSFPILARIHPRHPLNCLPSTATNSTTSPTHTPLSIHPVHPLPRTPRHSIVEQASGPSETSAITTRISSIHPHSPTRVGGSKSPTLTILTSSPSTNLFRLCSPIFLVAWATPLQSVSNTPPSPRIPMDPLLAHPPRPTTLAHSVALAPLTRTHILAVPAAAPSTIQPTARLIHLSLCPETLPKSNPAGGTTKSSGSTNVLGQIVQRHMEL
jgi:hypothetical protein